MPLVSLSTCWNSPRHTDGYEMIAEIAALGFRNVELSHGTRLSLVPGIMRALDEKLVRITSTHNFCPLPPGVNHSAPNMFTPSSSDERILMQWERYTRRTLDFAKQVGASIVVAHLGDVEFGWMNPARNVNNRQHGFKGDDEARLDKLREAAATCVEKGRRRKGDRWDRVFKALDLVLPQVLKHGLVLGAENREKCDELPLDEDMPELFQKFPAGSGLVYWHDTGHAHLKEKLGLIDQEELLRTNGPRLKGFHIHDVRGFSDHSPPGSGEIDFDMVGRYIRPEHFLTLELNPRLNPAEIVESKKFVVQRFGAEG